MGPHLYGALEALIRGAGAQETLGAALIRRWGDAIESAGSPRLLRRVEELLTETVPDAAGRPVRWIETEGGYDTLRHAIRDEQLAHIRAAPNPSDEVASLRRFMETVPAEDPRSRGQLFEEYMRHRIRDPQRRFAGIEGAELTRGSRTYAGARQADDIIQIAPGGGPPPGRYLVDYKAGEDAFRFEQAEAYAAHLASTPEAELRGVAFIFTGRNPRGAATAAEAASGASTAGREAAASARDAVARNARISDRIGARFRFGYIDNQGHLIWL